MDKTLYREFIWHLRYSESLFDAMRNINVDEKFLNELALHIAQIEKISVNSLPQGGGSAYVLSAAQNFIRICLSENFREKMPSVRIVNLLNVTGHYG